MINRQLLGLGATATPASTPACGDNPCGFLDYVWTSDACLAYLGCANPSDPLYVLNTQGAISGTASVVGSTVGSTVGNAAAATTNSLFSSAGVSGTIALAIAALAIVYVAMKA